MNFSEFLINVFRTDFVDPTSVLSRKYKFLSSKLRLIRHFGLFVALVAVCMFSAGCYQIIHVEDTLGNSIAGANVTTQMSQDFGGGPGPRATTNRFGDAWLKKTAYDNPPLWINVTKQGYRSRGIAYSPDEKVTIRLQQIEVIPE